MELEVENLELYVHLAFLSLLFPAYLSSWACVKDLAMHFHTELLFYQHELGSLFSCRSETRKSQNLNEPFAFQRIRDVGGGFILQFETNQ